MVHADDRKKAVIGKTVIFFFAYGLTNYLRQYIGGATGILKEFAGVVLQLSR
jgi:hypothetical protein